MEAPCNECIKAGPRFVVECRYTYKAPFSASKARRQPQEEQEQQQQQQQQQQQGADEEEDRETTTTPIPTPTPQPPLRRRTTGGLRLPRPQTPAPLEEPEDLESQLGSMDLDEDDSQTTPSVATSDTASTIGLNNDEATSVGSSTLVDYIPPPEYSDYAAGSDNDYESESGVSEASAGGFMQWPTVPAPHQDNFLPETFNGDEVFGNDWEFM